MSLADLMRPELRERLRDQGRREIVADLSAHPHVYHFVDFDSEDEYDLGEDAPADQQEAAAKARARMIDPADATIFSSLLVEPAEGEALERMHTVALDIDHRIRVVDSSTEGHGHLFIDHVMPWGDYLKLLHVMAEVGLVEPGYVAASERRLATHLRMPWVKKPAALD